MQVSLFRAFIVSSVFATSALAVQDDGPKPLLHPKKPYFDTAQHKVFWPLDKPFWIRLAESADNGAASFPLLPGDDKTGVNAGIALAASGLQHLQWVKNGKDMVAFDFIADGEPPRCSLSVKPGTMFTNGSCIWTGADIASAFTAHDRLSGLDRIYVSIENAPFVAVQEVKTPFTKEEPVHCRYYAVDRVGNASPVQAAEFCIDLSAPVTRISANGAADSIFTGAMSLRIASSDSLSGVRETLCGIDNENELSKVKSVVPLKGLKDGRHVAYFCAVDNVGNREKVKPFAFYIDNTPPVAELVAEGDCFPEKNPRFVSTRTLFKIEANDAVGTVDKIEFAIDNDPLKKSVGPISLLKARPGPHAILYRCADRLGNQSVMVKKEFNLDADPPVSQIDFKGTVFEQNGTVYITPETKIVVKAADNLSGVKKTAWSVDGGDQIDYKGPFTLAKEGVFKLRYASTDNVNNTEAQKSVPVAVDATPPTLIETFSRSGSTSDKEGLLFPAPVTLFLAATDSTSGVSAITYAINGAAAQAYHHELSFTAAGTYSVKIHAVDNVGKATDKTLAFKVVAAAR